MTKILVVGQTPPPMGGQAMMIQRLLEGKFDQIQLIHVRMAFSREMKDLGKIQLLKILHLFTVVLQIVYNRVVKNTRILYYPPSGADKIPLYRDVIILCLTRWMFKKTIFHFHASGISEIWNRLNFLEQSFFQLAFFNSDIGIALSDHVTNDVRFLKAKKCLIIPNGIEDNTLMIQKTKKKNSPVKILFVGLLRESKGEFILLEACKMLMSKNILFSLEVAGKFGSDDFEKQFYNLINTYQLGSKVNYIGLITGNKKKEVFANADLFCYPSYFESETFPVVILEAMQFSLPVISTNWRGIPEMVNDGKNGYLVEIRNVNAVADKLQLLIQDDKLRKQLGEEGRKMYLEKYSMNRFYENMKACFSAL